MCQGQCCHHVRREFQRKHWGFAGVHSSRFSYFQWRLPIPVILVYRFVLAVYCIVWLIYMASLGGGTKVRNMNIPGLAYLTNWTYFILTLYLTLHFVACIVYACKGGGSCLSQPSSEHHFGLFHELHVERSLWSSQDYEFVQGRPNSDEEVHLYSSDSSISILLKVVWILYSVASNFCLLVTLLFWIFLWPHMRSRMSDFGFMLNFQLHAVTSIIIIIEHLVSAVPVRLYHYIYSFIYAMIYLIFSLIYYAVDKAVIYPVLLDWGKPAIPAVLAVVVALIVGPLVHLFFFGFYKLKLFVYSTVVGAHCLISKYQRSVVQRMILVSIMEADPRTLSKNIVDSG